MDRMTNGRFHSGHGGAFMILKILKNYHALIRAEGEEAGRNKVFLPQSNWSYLVLLPLLFVGIIAVIIKPEELFFRVLSGAVGVICVSAHIWASIIFLIAYFRADKLRRLADAKAKAENTGRQ